MNRPPKTPMAAELERELVKIVGQDSVLTAGAELRSYDCDAYAPEKRYPDAVVLPRTTEEVSRIVKLCYRLSVPVHSARRGTRGCPAARRRLRAGWSSPRRA